MLLADKHVNL